MNTTKTCRLLLMLGILFLYSCGNKETKQSDNESKSDLKNESKKIAEKDQKSIVAKMENGKIVLTDKKNLITRLEKSMEANKTSKIDIGTIEIDVSKATDDEKTEIVQLIVSNKDNTEKVSYLLVRRANVFDISPTATVIKCVGCTVGCNPDRAKDGQGYCTDCVLDDTNPDEIKTCEKTETLAAQVPR